MKTLTNVIRLLFFVAVAIVAATVLALALVAPFAF